MSVLSKIACPASWSSVAVMLAVSATVGGIVVYLNHKKLDGLIKNSIEQMRAMRVVQWHRLDFRFGKPPCEHWTAGFVLC